jgi:hypothetical protein
MELFVVLVQKCRNILLLPLRIRTRISCEETLCGVVCSGKQHAVHPGHHHQPHKKWIVTKLPVT